MPKLEAREVRVEYASRLRNRVVAIQDVSLDVDEGEFVAIVGPSGCGKTTLLNVVGGGLPLTSGSVRLDGKEIRGYGPERATVFQAPSLLPWRTVAKNISYGLELQRRHRDPAAIQRVRDLITMTGLDGFEHAYPSELSGGMQQRVNLARALAVDPQVLLLDEPFAALDAQTREFMQEELLQIWQESHKTAMFITHQIDEAIYLADRVVVFTARPGRIREILKIDLPRPRPLSVKRSDAFRSYYDRIWSLLEEEGRKFYQSARASERESVAAE